MVPHAAPGDASLFRQVVLAAAVVAQARRRVAGLRTMLSRADCSAPAVPTRGIDSVLLSPSERTAGERASATSARVSAATLPAATQLSSNNDDDDDVDVDAQIASATSCVNRACYARAERHVPRCSFLTRDPLPARPTVCCCCFTSLSVVPFLHARTCAALVTGLPSSEQLVRASWSRGE